MNLGIENRDIFWLRGLTSLTGVFSWGCLQRTALLMGGLGVVIPDIGVTSSQSGMLFRHPYIALIIIKGIFTQINAVPHIYSCGCLAYCIYLLLKVETTILPSLNVLDIQTGLVIILCSSALTMVTGMAGVCGAITLYRGPLLLHCCLTTIECIGFLTAGTLALRNRVTIASRLEIEFNEMLKQYVGTNAPEDTIHKIHTIQSVLRCCGKNGEQDYLRMERSHHCFRAVSQYGCLRAVLNVVTTDLFNQSCVGLAGVFLLLLSLFSAASLMSSIQKEF